MLGPTENKEFIFLNNDVLSIFKHIQHKQNCSISGQSRIGPLFMIVWIKASYGGLLSALRYDIFQIHLQEACDGH